MSGAGESDKGNDQRRITTHHQRRIERRIGIIRDAVEEIKDAVDEIRDAITPRHSGGMIYVSGGFLLYVLIGIGWGFGVAEKSGDAATGAWSGLLWPLSLASQLARYYWR